MIQKQNFVMNEELHWRAPYYTYHAIAYVVELGRFFALSDLVDSQEVGGKVGRLETTLLAE